MRVTVRRVAAHGTVPPCVPWGTHRQLAGVPAALELQRRPWRSRPLRSWDDLILQELLRELLEEAGYAVHS